MDDAGVRTTEEGRGVGDDHALAPPARGARRAPLGAEESSAVVAEAGGRRRRGKRSASGGIGVVAFDGWRARKRKQELDYCLALPPAQDQRGHGLKRVSPV